MQAESCLSKLGMPRSWLYASECIPAIWHWFDYALGLLLAGRRLTRRRVAHLAVRKLNAEQEGEERVVCDHDEAAAHSAHEREREWDCI